MGAELGVVVPHRIQPHICNDVLAELHSVAGLARCGHDLMAVDGDQLVLIVLDCDDLLHGRGVAAQHHEVQAPQAHQKVHGVQDNNDAIVSLYGLACCSDSELLRLCPPVDEIANQ